MHEPNIVIVGGGHAAANLCAGLAAAGLGPRVHLVCEEGELPYQRPPLSKAFLKSPQEGLQALRAQSWYAENGITLHRADPVVSIARAQHMVQLQSGAELAYGQLVLATGARARAIPQLRPGLANVAVLRNAADALRLRSLLNACASLTVLGGGFIGLEIAAAARALGKAVTVLEAAPRLLARSVSAELAEHVLRTHRDSGMALRLGASVAEFELVGERLVSIAVNGQREAVELMVLGIGAEPEQALASSAGLECANGVVVDACLRTSDPAILAMGDCANFPEPGSGRRLRMESVQNANDQARTALATLLGRAEPYAAPPWFWSEQGATRLQMAGLLPEGAAVHRRTGANAASFSLLHYVGLQLRCVESANAPLDHLAARKLLELRKSPEPALACDPAVPLKAHC